jgi:hypothetical protein
MRMGECAWALYVGYRYGRRGLQVCTMHKCAAINSIESGQALECFHKTVKTTNLLVRPSCRNVPQAVHMSCHRAVELERPGNAAAGPRRRRAGRLRHVLWQSRHATHGTRPHVCARRARTGTARRPCQEAQGRCRGRRRGHRARCQRRGDAAARGRGHTGGRSALPSPRPAHATRWQQAPAARCLVRGLTRDRRRLVPRGSEQRARLPRSASSRPFSS